MTETGKILITGAAGFIGSHTCERMLREGYNIVGVDNLSDYYDPQLKNYNLRILKEFSNFHFIEGDIREFDFVQSLFRKYFFTNVVHLAAQAGVRFSLKNPFLYQQVNVEGSLNLLESAHRFDCQNFIFASSSSVYGDRSKVPFSEEDPITQPISVYASTKLAGEALCYAYHHLYDININCLRFFTVYGPRGRPDMAPHIFTSRILAEKEIKIFDNHPSTVSRDFTFVSDAVEGVLRTLKLEEGYQILNLGCGSPTKVMDFITILEKLTEKKARIKYIGRQPGDVETTCADISKAQKYLGFKPKIGIEEGLGRYVSWFTQYYNLI